jgi:hypothetical protein
MTLNILENRALPIDRRRLKWRDMVQKPSSDPDREVDTQLRELALQDASAICTAAPQIVSLLTPIEVP